MKDKVYEEEKDLSACETMIMKIIWEKGGDISLQELSELLKTRYDKAYARTTLVTFLLRMSGKGFITTYRKGRTSYITALRSENEYKQKRLKEETDFWYQGQVRNLFSALCQSVTISREDVREMRRMLDEMDGMD